MFSSPSFKTIPTTFEFDNVEPFWLGKKNDNETDDISSWSYR